MLFLVGYNNFAFLVFLYVGLVVGILYEITIFVCTICKNNIVLRNVFDVLVVFLGGFAFIFALNYAAFGYFRVYHLLTFFAGFIFERASIGFLVAKSCEFVYNKVIKLFRQIRRKCLDSRKTKDNS